MADVAAEDRFVPEGPSLVQLAEDWLTAKAVGARADDPGNSDRARRVDLCRWGRSICTVTARPVAERRRGESFDLETDLGQVGVADLTTETLLRSLASIRVTYATATAARSLATLRGFCRWLTKRGHLPADPTDDDLLVVGGVGQDYGGDSGAIVHAFSAEEVDAMRAAAAAPAARWRTAWPRRDEALLEILAGCGTRASETVELLVGHVDRETERPVLRVVRGTKGGRRREVPIPRRAFEAVDAYLAERQVRSAGNPLMAVEKRASLWLRADGRPMDVYVLDRFVRRVAGDAGVELPGDAAAHGFRHHLGVQLALRNVPVPVIQAILGHADPRTTAVYMRMAGRHLVDALDDAGWL